MNLCNINHSFNYETEKLCRLFLPFEKINILDYIEESELYAVTTVLQNEQKVTAELYINGKEYKSEKNIVKTKEDASKVLERAIAVCLYNCFTNATGYTAKWGILTGVRPAKLYSSLVKSMGQTAAEQYFKDELLVSSEKVELCRDTSVGENMVINKSTPNSFSLYISIPFCPSRCAYCSFVSHSVEKSQKLIPDYLEKLLIEIELTAKIAKQNGLRLKTIYIGGGTPTTLSAEQLTAIMDCVKDNFDLTNLLEYTVEAGRPDTITEEKLIAIKNGGATRISINPQTMNDAVLEAVGRRHTAKDAENAFILARKLGFNNINMDLIAGLPSDTAESFKSSVDQIINLNPENVTVHSLSLKRASNFNKNKVEQFSNDGSDASDMVCYAKKALSDAGILPYYMYRQSKTIGNLENVGYAKKGFEGYYNVYIMDETHTILACGASAVTKLREPYGKTIERIFNYKYPYEYISGFDELMARKAKISEFYNRYSNKT